MKKVGSLLCGIGLLGTLQAQDNQSFNDIGSFMPAASQPAPAQPAPAQYGPEKSAEQKTAPSTAALQWDEKDNADNTITTVNQERGNWYFKAKILKETRQVYEQLRKALQPIEPQVQEYLKNVPNGIVKVDNELEGEYNVHVYEVKNDHTATFNWYRVSIKNGEVRSEF